MSEVRLSAKPRTEFGKGGARRTRRAGKIPAVIYGHGADPRHVSLSAREFGQAIKRGGANVLLTLDLGGSSELAIPKAIQRHPIKGVYEHVDLLAVRQGEKVRIEVPITVTGEIIRGGLLAQEAMTVSIEAEATHLPSGFEISIEGLEIGSQLTAADLTLPAGSVLAGDPEQLLVVVQEAPTAEQMEAGEEVPEGEEAVEGEAAAAAAGAEAPAEPASAE